MSELIDRQAAIDALRCCMDVFVTNQPTLIYREEVLTALRLVPSAQKWIPCSECCGSWAGGPTASGAMPSAGRTVACDLPFGTRLLIEGHEYVVEDRGVSGMWVDIFVNDHQEALNRGMYSAEVYIIE